jgi:hypothetical protein
MRCTLRDAFGGMGPFDQLDCRLVIRRPADLNAGDAPRMHAGIGVGVCGIGCLLLSGASGSGSMGVSVQPRSPENN